MYILVNIKLRTCFGQSWPSSGLTLRDTVKPEDDDDWPKHVVWYWLEYTFFIPSSCVIGYPSTYNFLLSQRGWHPLRFPHICCNTVAYFHIILLLFPLIFNDYSHFYIYRLLHILYYVILNNNFLLKCLTAGSKCCFQFITSYYEGRCSSSTQLSNARPCWMPTDVVVTLNFQCN